jgi:hypothetical protein
MIPAHLLNADIEYFLESETAGSFGELKQVFTPAGTGRGRLDMKSSTRNLHAGIYEETGRRYRMYVNELLPEITEKFWIRAKANGYTVLGQISSISYPGLMAHHIELDIAEYTYQDLP